MNGCTAPSGRHATTQWRPQKSGRTLLRKSTFVIAFFCFPAGCLAASMPGELRGEYTFGTADQCGYLSVTASGFRTNEDLGCTALKIQRLDGSPGERSSFQAEFICQIDDPKKVGMTGLLQFAKLRDI
jgi:hypothetical protein